MNIKHLNQLLVVTFPDLANNYHAEVDWQEGDETGCHVVYGDVFAPYIEKIIAEKRYDEIQKVFIFLEQILSYEDKYYKEVVMFSVLERLMCNKEYFAICKDYFGELTEIAIKEIT